MSLTNKGARRRSGINGCCRLMNVPGEPKPAVDLSSYETDSEENDVTTTLAPR